LTINFSRVYYLFITLSITQVAFCKKLVRLNDTIRKQERIDSLPITKHLISLSYSKGFGAEGLDAEYFHQTPGLTKFGTFSPRGHRAVVVGYQYRPLHKIEIHAGIQAGLGYTNGTVPLNHRSISINEPNNILDITQQEYGAELMANITLKSEENYKTEVGIGGTYKAFNVEFTTGPNTEAETKSILIPEGTTYSFSNNATLVQFQIRYSYILPQKYGAVQLSAVHQLGKYGRTSVRFGYSIAINKKDSYDYANHNKPNLDSN
jgi:hypothetical protein